MSDEDDPLKRVEELLRKASKPATPAPAEPKKEETKEAPPAPAPPKVDVKPYVPSAPKVEPPKVDVKPYVPSAPRVEPPKVDVKPYVPSAPKVEPPKVDVKPYVPSAPKVEPKPAVTPPKVDAKLTVTPPKVEAKPVARTDDKGKPAAATPKKPKSGKMSEPHVEKLVVNIGVGEAGEKLTKAEKVLMMVTKQKAIRTISKTTNKDLGIRWGMPLGCKVTLRRKAAEEFLKNALYVKDNKIAAYSFDPNGNFSFGITDFTDFPGQKYSPDIGIFGMDVSVVVARPGRRVALRDHASRKIPRRHRLTRQETIDWLKKKFGVEVVD